MDKLELAKQWLKSQPSNKRPLFVKTAKRLAKAQGVSYEDGLIALYDFVMAADSLKGD